MVEDAAGVAEEAPALEAEAAAVDAAVYLPAPPPPRRRPRPSKTRIIRRLREGIWDI